MAECTFCGHPNDDLNKFCGLCGTPLPQGVRRASSPPLEPAGSKPAFGAPARHAAPAPSPTAPPENGPGQHHYHHHYHHIISNDVQGLAPIAGLFGSDRNSEVVPARAPLSGPTVGRGESALRKMGQDYVLACNTKHLEDLIEHYSSDAIVMRSNHPPIRGSASIREFFVAQLDGGFGEVELEPLRVEVIGDIAFDAGRCKMLVPSAVGKRREERGKYLFIYARQEGVWKITADCWASDLALTVATEPEPANKTASVMPRPGITRKGA